jgi:hypothetical protein
MSRKAQWSLERGHVRTLRIVCMNRSFVAHTSPIGAVHGKLSWK